MFDDNLIENICDMVELNRYVRTFPQNDDDTRSCRSNPDDILCSSEFNLRNSPRTRRSNRIMMPPPPPGTMKRRSKSQNRRRRGGGRRNGLMRSISSIFSDSSCSNTTVASSRWSSTTSLASSIGVPSSPPANRFAYQRKKASTRPSPIQKLAKHMSRSSDHR